MSVEKLYEFGIDAFAVDQKGKAMACIGDKHQCFFAVDCCLCTLFGHAAGNKIIGQSMDHQQRQAVIPQGIDRRCTINGKSCDDAAADVGTP